MAIHVRQTGEWKRVCTPYMKQNGAWYAADETWVKQEGVWKLVYPDPEMLLLPSSTNVNLGAWLQAQGAPVGCHVGVLIEAGEIVGGNIHWGNAITVGDISMYKSVRIDVAGEVQGMGGEARSGGNAIHTDHPLVVNVLPGGAIRAGGGAGGTGGKGADGEYVYHTPPYSESNWYNLYQPVEGSGLNANFWRNADYCRYNNSSLGSPNNYMYILSSTHAYRSYGYESGGKYRIATAHRNPITGGAGGTGGTGQGYQNPDPTNRGGSTGGNPVGSPGYESVNTYGGKGGTGGTGGLWGVGGSKGNGGGSGKHFVDKGSTDKDSYRRAIHDWVDGVGGATGKNPGKAIHGSGVLTLTNNGTIDGSVTNPTS